MEEERRNNGIRREEREMPREEREPVARNELYRGLFPEMTIKNPQMAK